MSYMALEEQINRHVNFLRGFGIEIHELLIDSSAPIRVNYEGRFGKKEYAYKTASRRLNNGCTGLITWCRHSNGEIGMYKTYGHPLYKEVLEVVMQSCEPMSSDTFSRPCPRRIQKFWEQSNRQGEADYLRKKAVGSYGIRFRMNQYGSVAVVPMVDAHNKLRGYQILNSDGSKVFAKGTQCSGLFHPLTKLINGSPVGISESYVTAATCMELTGLSMVTAFTCANLSHVVTAIGAICPKSPLIIFADNDRHLSENKGVISAQRAIENAKTENLVVVPCFKDCPLTKEYSDWNDLVRTIGRKNSQEQISKSLTHSASEWTQQIVIKLMEL